MGYRGKKAQPFSSGSCALMLPACLLCAACVFSERYPDDWSPVIVGATECPDISGTYENVGQLASDREYPVRTELRLSNHFFGHGLGFDRRITISQTDEDTIQASTYGDDSHEPHIFSRKDGGYVCNDGSIWLSSESGWVGFGFGIGRESMRIGFVKTEDGSLVGGLRESAAGVGIIGAQVGVPVPVPFFGSFGDYIRWNAVDDPPSYQDPE